MTHTDASNPAGLIPVAQYVRMSTEHQKYSIANQSALILAYAQEHGMRIVRTYADPGRSGLTMERRPGLRSLLADVLARSTRFEAVLVYDMSRWGRFQDSDESAHYEFICKSAGVRVVYCAEPFCGDTTPFGSMAKAFKRAMAAEFSRELSIKVSAGKTRLASLGFRIGGVAGFGLRRRILESGNTPGLLLRDGQRKSIITDRVTLVPGPAEEVALVRRIYRDYIYLAKSETQIAATLNAEGSTCGDRAWSRMRVRTILSNEKYVGTNVVGRYRYWLDTKPVRQPRDTWTRCERAFEAIVSRQTFEAAQAVRAFNRKEYITREYLLEVLRKVLKRHGRLTAQIINRARELPSAQTVEVRFGSLSTLYQMLGFTPAPRDRHHLTDMHLKNQKNVFEDGIVRTLQQAGTRITRASTTSWRINDGLTFEVRVCRCHEHRVGRFRWRLCYQRSADADVLIAIRMQPDNVAIHDLLVLPRSISNSLPLFLSERDEDLLAPWVARNVEVAIRKLLSLGDPTPNQLNVERHSS